MAGLCRFVALSRVLYLTLNIAVFVSIFNLCSGYKPVIVVHGILDNPTMFTGLKDFIEEAHPKTNVTIIDLYDDIDSLLPLWQQVVNFSKVMRPIMQSAQDGIHLIGFSQDTEYLKWLFPNYLREELYKVCYKVFGQDVSVCNYWNDPHHHDLYLKFNSFLPVLNNQVNGSEEYKKNFIKLKNLVLIGGPDDGVITPWQSSHFGFYDSSEKVIEMTSQQVFKNDTFGLRTLSERGAITTYSIAGVEHTTWHKNLTVFNKAIKPWLT
uniref:palmitoyl-CoA hydrolase n=1 Tax=Saccoglossus kowalevskii TaxID=10224 RepID=A0ABM0MMR0_SACKO|nr:PREDICTED: lysosomal thioesterase PPT2-A-like [Saccoglossus kowalevskii]